MKGLYILFTLLLVQSANAQDKYFAKDGYISFFSHSLVEDIKADNNQVLSIIDTETGEIAIQLLMRSFIFKKALMQEHFNENYVESHKYPKATFNGIIVNFKELIEQESEVEITGLLKVHGKEKNITTQAKMNRSKDEITLSGEFMVSVADFDIKIPAVVVNNIAKNIKISFEIHHKPYNK